MSLVLKKDFTFSDSGSQSSEDLREETLTMPTPSLADPYRYKLVTANGEDARDLLGQREQSRLFITRRSGGTKDITHVLPQPEDVVIPSQDMKRHVLAAQQRGATTLPDHALFRCRLFNASEFPETRYLKASGKVQIEINDTLSSNDKNVRCYFEVPPLDPSQDHGRVNSISDLYFVLHDAFSLDLPVFYFWAEPESVGGNHRPQNPSQQRQNSGNPTTESSKNPVSGVRAGQRVPEQGTVPKQCTKTAKPGTRGPHPGTRKCSKNTTTAPKNANGKRSIDTREDPKDSRPKKATSASTAVKEVKPPTEKQMSRPQSISKPQGIAGRTCNGSGGGRLVRIAQPREQQGDFRQLLHMFARRLRKRPLGNLSTRDEVLRDFEAYEPVKVAALRMPNTDSTKPFQERGASIAFKLALISIGRPASPIRSEDRDYFHEELGPVDSEDDDTDTDLETTDVLNSSDRQVRNSTVANDLPDVGSTDDDTDVRDDHDSDDFDDHADADDGDESDHFNPYNGDAGSDRVSNTFVRPGRSEIPRTQREAAPGPEGLSLLNRLAHERARITQEGREKDMHEQAVKTSGGVPQGMAPVSGGAPPLSHARLPSALVGRPLCNQKARGITSVELPAETLAKHVATKIPACNATTSINTGGCKNGFWNSLSGFERKCIMGKNWNDLIRTTRQALPEGFAQLPSGLPCKTRNDIQQRRARHAELWQGLLSFGFVKFQDVPRDALKLGVAIDEKYNNAWRERSKCEKTFWQGLSADDEENDDEDSPTKSDPVTKGQRPIDATHLPKSPSPNSGAAPKSPMYPKFIPPKMNIPRVSLPRTNVPKFTPPKTTVTSETSTDSETSDAMVYPSDEYSDSDPDIAEPAPPARTPEFVPRRQLGENSHKGHGNGQLATPSPTPLKPRYRQDTPQAIPQRPCATTPKSAMKAPREYNLKTPIYRPAPWLTKPPATPTPACRITKTNTPDSRFFTPSRGVGRPSNVASTRISPFSQAAYDRSLGRVEPRRSNFARRLSEEARKGRMELMKRRF